MGFNLKETLNGIIRIAAKTNPVTAVLADALLPARVAAKTGEDPGIVEKIVAGIREDAELIKAQMDHEKEMMELGNRAAEIGSSNLQALDTGPEFSFKKGLLGSPRRFGVTILSGSLGFLITNAGLRAIWIGDVAKDPDGLAMILKFGGATLFGLAGAYVSKYFSSNGK